MSPLLIRRLARFGLVGGLTTLVAYGVFIGLLRVGLHYAVASAGAWAVGVGISFTLNRRYTFEIDAKTGKARDLAIFAGGAVLQLLLGLTGYAVMIGQLHMAATPAFVANLVLTSSFSFLFMKWVTFRPRLPEAGP